KRVQIHVLGVTTGGSGVHAPSRFSSGLVYDSHLDRPHGTTMHDQFDSAPRGSKRLESNESGMMMDR
ncbi:hypothetical protein EDD11_007601, partial [Mortierella claussenii]